MNVNRLENSISRRGTVFEQGCSVVHSVLLSVKLDFHDCGLFAVVRLLELELPELGGCAAGAGRVDLDAMHSRTIGIADLDTALGILADGAGTDMKVLVDPNLD